jgi:hypothetical protein
MAMSDPNQTATDDAGRARAAFVFQLVGAVDALIGIGLILLGPMLVPGIDLVWRLVGAVMVVTALAIVIFGRRMDPSNRTR